MRRSRPRSWLLALAVLGCEDPGADAPRDAAVSGDAAVDAAVVDRGPVADVGARDARVDGGRRDVGVVLDARATDALPRDAVVADGARDAVSRPDAWGDAQHPRDAAADVATDLDVGVDAHRDAHPPDTAMAADVRLPDSAVDAAIDAAQPGPDACIGVVLPPLAESVNGEEVCNYVDDDGDGLVDEGFEYRPLAHGVPVLPEPRLTPRSCELRWNGERFAISWVGGGYLATAAADLCPASEPLFIVNDDGGWPSEVRLAQTPSAFAVAFLDAGRGRVYVQMFSTNGVPLTRAIAVGQRNGLPRFFFDITPVGDDFAVFVESPDGRGTYELLNRDGDVLRGPLPVLPEGASFLRGFGIGFDGVALGLAWDIGGDLSEAAFMRWSLNGEIVTPPLGLGRGYQFPNHIVGMEVVGRQYLVAYIQSGARARVAEFDASREPPVRFVDPWEVRSGIEDLIALPNQLLMTGVFVVRDEYARTSRNGDILQVSALPPRTFVCGVTAVGDGPFAFLMVPFGVVEEGGAPLPLSRPYLQYVGCGGE